MSRAESVVGTASGAGSKLGNKKKRVAEKDEEDEKAPKRGKITYARD